MFRNAHEQSQVQQGSLHFTRAEKPVAEDAETSRRSDSRVELEARIEDWRLNLEAADRNHQSKTEDSWGNFVGQILNLKHKSQLAIRSTC